MGARVRNDSGSARRHRQEPFDELSARMESTWRGSFELFIPRKSRRQDELEA